MQCIKACNNSDSVGPLPGNAPAVVGLGQRAGDLIVGVRMMGRHQRWQRRSIHRCARSSGLPVERANQRAPASCKLSILCGTSGTYRIVNVALPFQISDYECIVVIALFPQTITFKRRTHNIVCVS